jgi:hypothetical protein
MEDVPRAVVAIGNEYPDGHAIAPHRHRRGQLMWGTSGAILLTTPQGTSVMPPQRGMWIPPGTLHNVRMLGDVSIQSVLLEPEMAQGMPDRCQVVGISPFLRGLITEALDLPAEYDLESRAGALSSAWAYRHDFRPFGPVSLRALGITSLIGGGLGALLLLHTPAKAFDIVVPWLLVAATLAFIFGRQAGLALRRVVTIGPGTMIAVQFVLAIYGGYFGGAVGIVMMAAWSLLSEVDLKVMGPTRTVLVAGCNSVAVVFFLFSGEIWWRETGAMLIGATLGGYAGARLTRLVTPQHLRAGVIVLSVAMTVIFFFRHH